MSVEVELGDALIGESRFRPVLRMPRPPRIASSGIAVASPAWGVCV